MTRIERINQDLPEAWHIDSEYDVMTDEELEQLYQNEADAWEETGMRYSDFIY